MAAVVHVQDIYQLAPHRDPMIWMDEITQYSAEGGEGRLHLKSDGHYMSPTGLRPSSCLEIMGQAFGFILIAHTRRKLKRAFLAGFSDVEFPNPRVIKECKTGDSLTVKILGVRQIGPISAFRGEVWLKDALLCRCKMKVFSER